jgi:hypothetical protein
LPGAAPGDLSGMAKQENDGGGDSQEQENGEQTLTEQKVAEAEEEGTDSGGTPAVQSGVESGSGPGDSENGEATAVGGGDGKAEGTEGAPKHSGSPLDEDDFMEDPTGDMGGTGGANAGGAG